MILDTDLMPQVSFAPDRFNHNRCGRGFLNRKGLCHSRRRGKEGPRENTEDRHTKRHGEKK